MRSTAARVASGWVLALVVTACAAGAGDPVVPRAGSGGVGASGGLSGSGAGSAAIGFTGGGLSVSPAGCSAAVSDAPSSLHAAALGVLADPMGSCAGSDSCHKGSGRAKLVLAGATDLRTLLVGKPSCQAPSVPLVDPAGGEFALVNSWLWIKLTHPLDADDNIKAVPAWGTTPGACNQLIPESFGQRMPYSIGRGYWTESRLAPVRNWLCAGAPGP